MSLFTGSELQAMLHFHVLIGFAVNDKLPDPGSPDLTVGTYYNLFRFPHTK